MSQSIRTAALIGLGNIAWRYDSKRQGASLTHFSTYSQARNVKVVTGYDPDEQSRSAFSAFSRIATSDSLDALFFHRPDIVSITSPTQFHSEHLERCLRAEVPMIWLEKPICDSVYDAQSLLELQNSIGKSKVMLGYQRRYLPVFRRLKSLISENKTFGECASITIHYSKNLETNGVHYVDLLHFLLGDIEPDEVVVAPTNMGQSAPSFFVSFSNNMQCSVIGVELPYHSLDIAAQFENGRCSVLYSGLAEKLENKVKHQLYPGFHRLAPTRLNTESTDTLAFEMESVFPLMLNDLLNAYEKNTHPISNLSTGLLTQKLVSKVRAVD